MSDTPPLVSPSREHEKNAGGNPALLTPDALPHRALRSEYAGNDNLAGPMDSSETSDTYLTSIPNQSTCEPIAPMKPSALGQTASTSEDEAATKINARMKGVYVRRELARGRSDRFADQSHQAKVGDRKLQRLHRWAPQHSPVDGLARRLAQRLARRLV